MNAGENTEDIETCLDLPDNHSLDTNPDCHQPQVKPARRKKSKSSKTKHATDSCSLVENIDTNSIPDGDDKQSLVQKRSSVDRLADQLQSELLEVIEAGEAGDFEDEVEPPVDPGELVEVHTPDGNTSPFLGQPPCREITQDLVPNQTVTENSGEVEKNSDAVSLLNTRSSFPEQGRNATTASVCRPRVRTPPTLEETSAALQAIEHAGRISPVDITELVGLWKHGKTRHPVPLVPVDVDTDEELPAFNIGLKKPSQRVFDKEIVDKNTTGLETGLTESEVVCVEQCTQPFTQNSISSEQEPWQGIIKPSFQADTHEGCFVPEENGDVSAIRTQRDGFVNGKDSNSKNPVTDFNQNSASTWSENVKTQSGHVSFTVPWFNSRHQGSVGKEKGEVRSAFWGPRDFLAGESQSSSWQRNARSSVHDKSLGQHMMADSLSFNDTNDEELFVAALATHTAQCHNDRHQITNNSTNVSTRKMAEDSQITFTQALACVHDSIDIRTGSQNIYGSSVKADRGLEKSVVTNDRPQFDLGFELSDDDDDDDLCDDEDDEDIIPPSPPAASSWRSGTRLTSRSNSLITISRKSSFGSIPSSGHMDDARDICNARSEKSDFVPKESDVGNVCTPDLGNVVENVSPRTITSQSLLKKHVRLDAVATEKKLAVSTTCSPLPQFGTAAVDAPWQSELNILTTEQNSTPASNTGGSVESEQKSKGRRMTPSDAVAADQKSVAVIRPCVRSHATPTTLAGQSEMISPPAVISASTPFKQYMDEKYGKLSFCH